MADTPRTPRNPQQNQRQQTQHDRKQQGGRQKTVREKQRHDEPGDKETDPRQQKQRLDE